MFYILYTFWAQYVFNEVTGILSILGLVILFLTVMEKKKINKYRILLPLILFLILLVGISLINGSVSMRYTFQIAKYLIPCFGIFAYATKSENHFRKILFIFSIACVLLSVSLWFKGEVNREGARQLADLNVNLASNFLTIGFFSTLFLIEIKKIIIFRNLYYVIVCGILCSAQMLCASRRGFIIMIFLLAAYIFCWLAIMKRKHYVTKIMIMFMILLVIIFLLNIYGETFSNMVVVRRLLGEHTTGDLARAQYKIIALCIFKNNPLIGSGLGAVEKIAGAYSHSLYYELLACTGTIGFSLMIGYLIHLFRKTWKLKIFYIDYIKERAFQSFFMMFFVLSLFISGITMVYIYESYFYMIIGIVCSYICLYTKIIK